jgi:hypothetical protein
MELRLLKESNVSLLIHQYPRPLSYLIFTPQKLYETLYKAFIEPEFSIHGLAAEGLDCPWQEELAALDAKMRLFLAGKPLACVEEMFAAKRPLPLSVEVVTAAAEEVPPISQHSSHSAELLHAPEQFRSHPVLGPLSATIPIRTQKNGVALSVGAAIGTIAMDPKLVLTCVFFVFLMSALTIVGIFTLFVKGAGY